MKILGYGPLLWLFCCPFVACLVILDRFGLDGRDYDPTTDSDAPRSAPIKEGGGDASTAAAMQPMLRV